MLLVKPATSIMLIDRQQGGRVINNHRPTVSDRTTFVESHIARGVVKMIAELKDGATDDEFVKYMAASEGKEDLAVASFLSKWDLKAEPAEDDEKVVAKAPKAKKAD